METQELVFIPGPGMGHLVSAVEFSKLITGRDSRLFITILFINLKNHADFDKYVQSLQLPVDSQITFVHVPLDSDTESKSNPVVAVELIKRHKPFVRQVVIDMNRSKKVSGIIIDMFCVDMIDVANEFMIPSYTFFTSSAGFLSLLLHVQVLHDEMQQDVTEYKDTDVELLVQGFENLVPAKVLPSPMLDKFGGIQTVLHTARRIRETKGIMINTFLELEEKMVKALLSDSKVPRVFPVGPIINLELKQDDDNVEIMRWLDNQPDSSVVFLCFGSYGSFNEDQTKEIAFALERVGYRFLWSLRKPAERKFNTPSGYTNPEEVLPQGFLQRTSGLGKVIGWAPQVAVLSHSAIGGFVSHCGWNSILESLWFGVPIATWPIYAEQQMNAFEMVVELGISVDVKMDYRTEKQVIVPSSEIERALKQLMTDDGVRKKVKDLSQRSQRCLMEGGSSYKFLGQLTDDLIMQKCSILHE